MELPLTIQYLAKKHLYLNNIDLLGHQFWTHLKRNDHDYYFNNKQNYPILNLSWKEKIYSTLKELLRLNLNSSSKSIDKVLFFKILNGYTIMNYSQKLVIKITLTKYEPNFLLNYQIADKSLSNNIPKIIKSGNQDRYQFIVTELITKYNKIDWSQWSETLPQISPLMEKLYFSNSIKSVSSKIYIQKLLKQMKIDLKNKKYIRPEFTEIITLIQKCFTKYHLSQNMQFTLFVHGDLVPNNIIKTNNNYMILDWDNGGFHNFMYDLFMQDFYFEDRPIWHNFANLDITGSDRKILFNGWTNYYISMIKRHLHTTLSNSQVKVSIIICLAEIAEKNFLRHQSEEASHDGKEILDLVSKHCRSILK